MANHDKWTRRSVVAAIAGTGLLPFVPLLQGDAQGQAAPVPKTLPKRLVIWFYPNGTLPAAYFPRTAGGDFEMTPILEPLAPHRDRLIVTRGIRLNAYDAGPKIVHISCVAALLTGRPLPRGAFAEGATAYGWAAGPSADQIVATAIGSATRYPSLEFHNVGFQDRLKTQFRVVYKAANQPLTGMRDPREAFDRLFKDSSSVSATRSNQLQLGVLDHVKTRLDKLLQKVGSDDRLKVEAHLQAVVDIEKRLAMDTSSCKPTPLDFAGDVAGGDCGQNDNGPACPTDALYPDIGKAHMDLIVRAFACDQTRVASLQWGAGGRGSHFPFLTGGPRNEHLVSHLGVSDPSMEPTKGLYVRMKRWYMEQLAYLVAQLKAVPEGDGTLMDNTLIVACSEHGVGANHSPDDIPFLLVGGGWYFKTGRYLTYQARSNNDLLLSVCHAMGLDKLTEFGDPRYCSGPLPGLVA